MDCAARSRCSDSIQRPVGTKFAGSGVGKDHRADTQGLSLRVLSETGVEPVDYRTVTQHLPVIAKPEVQHAFSAACAAHTGLGPHPWCSTMSRRCTSKPTSLMVSPARVLQGTAHGTPDHDETPTGRRGPRGQQAETATMLLVINAFNAVHQTDQTSPSSPMLG
jgi:hypothetical protein